MGVFSNAKDRVLEQLAISYLNTSLLAPYGHATSLKIDSSAKTLGLEVELKGESTPVKIEITDYEIVLDEGRYFVSAKEIKTSREWLTVLAREQLRKGRLELPPQAGQLLFRVL